MKVLSKEETQEILRLTMMTIRITACSERNKQKKIVIAILVMQIESFARAVSFVILKDKNGAIA
jgi:putative AlgH/UPF0301 family transcriptional regulator